MSVQSPVLAPPQHPEGPRRPPRRRRRGVVTRVAGWSTRHRALVLIGWVAFVIAAVVAGGASGTKQIADADGGSGQSRDADRVLAGADFGEKPTENVLFSALQGKLDAAAVAAAVTDLRETYAAMPQVASVSDVQKSTRTDTSMIQVVLAVPAGSTATEADDAAAAEVDVVSAATAKVAKNHPELRIEQVGDASLNKSGEKTVADDFKRAELTSLPVTLIILVVVFGALVAASVPILLALSAVMTAIGLSALASHLVPVDDALSSVILLVGMAVGIDYSLFYVRREREERARGASKLDALELAAETAGHTVVVSGFSVIVAMSGMFFSGSAIFVSFGIGTILVVAVAVLGSLTALPALLATLGDGIDRPRIPFLHRRSRRNHVEAGSARDGGSRIWSAVLTPVLKFPKTALVMTIVALLALASPVLGMKLGSPGIETLPRSIPGIVALDRLTDAFPGKADDTHVVELHSTTTAVLDKRATTQAMDALIGSAGRTAGFSVDADTVPDFSADGRVVRISLPITDISASSGADASLKALRTNLAPAALGSVPHSAWAVTGATAGDHDFDQAVTSSLPLVLLFVLGLTFLVLVVSFRAPVIAAVAVGLNLLSVGAAYGVLVLVFQHTWAEGILGFHGNGKVVSWLPLFAFVILFGLSTDYTVLVVSRIREGVQRGLDPVVAVREGIVRTAGVVTSAAVIMVAVFSIFGTLSLLEFKQLGIGLAAAILIDATVVRAVLLPAALAALGRRAWLAPAWMK